VFERENAELRAEKETLRAENKDLKRHLAQNSQNSSKPPVLDVTDIAPAVATGTEHRLHQRRCVRCGCGKVTTAPRRA
jgi:hypothetical protein